MGMPDIPVPAVGKALLFPEWQPAPAQYIVVGAPAL